MQISSLYLSWDICLLLRWALLLTQTIGPRLGLIPSAPLVLMLSDSGSIIPLAFLRLRWKTVGVLAFIFV